MPAARFGVVSTEGSRVVKFAEKPSNSGTFINGGFFVLSPKVIDYIDGDMSIWEREPLGRLAAAGQLHAYQHLGFWQPMDTLREREELGRPLGKRQGAMESLEVTALRARCPPTFSVQGWNTIT